MKAVCILGLPGSGKSTLSVRLSHQNSKCRIFDDFMARSLDDSVDPAHAEDYPLIVHHLREDGRVILVDNQLVLPTFRHRLVQLMRFHLSSHLQFEWHALDCSTLDSIDRCRRNIHYRHSTQGRSVSGPLESLGLLFNRATYPVPCVLHEVVDAQTFKEVV